MTSSFEITYDMDRVSHAAVIRKKLFHRPRFYLRLALCIVIGLWLYLNGERLFGLTLTLTLVVLSLITWWIAPNRWLSVNRYLLERRTATFSPETLGFRTASVKGEFPWTHFLCWDESKAFFTLDLTRGGFCSVIPKSAMTDEQEKLFRKWAAAKLPKYPQYLRHP